MTDGFSLDVYGLTTHLAIAGGLSPEWYVLGFVAGSFGAVPVLGQAAPEFADHAIWDGAADGQLKVHQGEMAS